MEIKYRAWHKRFCFFRPVDTFILFPDGKVSFEDEEGNWVCDINDNLDIMQSTGVQDRTGNEIYKGDILLDTGTGKFAPVEVSHGNFFVNWGRWPDWSWEEMASDHTDRIKVIGNCHENPELLKEERR